jgi:class 3 adenylate cyclase
VPELPAPVVAYILGLVVDVRSPAYLLVEPSGRLAEWGGALDAYGISELEQGKDAGEQVAALASLFPLAEPALCLPRIEVAQGAFADVHAFLQPEGAWVVLLNATAEARQEGVLQQKANELSLLRDKQHRIMRQYLGRDVDLVEKMVQGLLGGREADARQSASVLVARLRGFSAFSERNPPRVVFDALGVYLRALTDALLAGGGIVDATSADGLLAVFGVLPSSESPAIQAVRTAGRLVSVVKEARVETGDGEPPPFHLGAGVASGPIVLSVVRGQGQRTFSAVGQAVDRATHLEREARRWEIVIDWSTHAQLGEEQAAFAPAQVTGSDIAAGVFSRVLG